MVGKFFASGWGFAVEKSSDVVENNLDDRFLLQNALDSSLLETCYILLLYILLNDLAVVRSTKD